MSLVPVRRGALDALINRHTVAGERYNDATQREIDTENF